MSDLIHLSTQDRILTIQMNRPEKKNALTLDMYTRMASAMRAAEADPNVRVILFTGAGGNFTSGNDLGDFAVVSTPFANPVGLAFFPVPEPMPLSILLLGTGVIRLIFRRHQQ